MSTLQLKSAPLSLRLSSELDEYVTREAQRTQRSKTKLLELLATEAANSRMFPRIAFRGTDYERRPWVIGTGFDVWQIVEAVQDLGSVDAVVNEGVLSTEEVHTAMTYYQRFPNEIDAAIKSNQRTIEELRKQYPIITG